MDFVSVWKACSIVLTGAFGVLGLFRDFKHKGTQKVTRWGYISLGGILLSTALGVTAQLIQASHESVARQRAAEETLTLVRKIDATLNTAKKSLSLLDDAKMFFYFVIPCEDERYARLCPQTGKDGVTVWPQGGRLHLKLHMSVYARDSIVGGESDLKFDGDLDSDPKFCRACSDVMLAPGSFLGFFEMIPYGASGKIRSKIDLSEAHILIDPINDVDIETGRESESLISIGGMSLLLKDGEFVAPASSRIEKFQNRPYLHLVLPKQPDA
jgi:hypothetical protein